MKTKKKALLFLVPVAVILLGVLAWLIWPKQKPPQEQTKEPPSMEEADTVPPEVTFALHEELTVKVGETLRLPAAYAKDNVDGDMTDQLFVIAADMGPVLTKVEDTEEIIYDFLCYAKGTYRIAYKVTDSSDNNGTGVLTVNVTATRDDETTISDEENQLSNLTKDGGVYKENFAKGWMCPLAEYGLPTGVYLSTTEDAIAGTSMIMTDFSQIVKFGIIGEYTSGDGYYDVSFDLKLVSGKGTDNFYVSFADLATDQGLSDARFPLGTLSVGKTTHFEATFRPYGVEKCYLRFFVYNETTDMVLAIDNLEIRHRKPIETYIPTAAEIERGYTWDWSTKTMDVDCGEIVDKPSFITSGNFGKKVLKISVPVGRGIVFFGTMNTLIAGERYQVDFDYYVADESDDFHMYYHVPDTTTTNIGSFGGTAGKSGSRMVRFVAQDGDKAFALYCAGTTNGRNAVLYIGNFTLKKIEPAVKTDIPTVSQVKAGYTWDWSTKTMDMGNEKGEIINRPAELSGIAGFGGKVLKITMAGAYEGLRFTGTNGIFKAGKTYRITANIYAPESSGGFNIYWNLESATMTGLTNFNDSITGKGKAYNLKVTFTAQEGDTIMGWYPAALDGTAVIYIGDFTVVETDPPMKTDKPTASQIKAGYTWDWSDKTMNMDNNQGEIISKPAELSGVTGFGSKVLKLTMASAGAGTRFTGTDGIFIAGKTYKISTTIYAPESSGGFNIYWNLESTTMTGLLVSFNDGITGKGKAYNLNITFTAQEGDTVMGWYPAGLDGTAVIYIGDFTIEETDPPMKTDKPTASQIKAGYTWDWSDKTMNMDNNQGEIIDRPAELSGVTGFGSKLLKLTMASAGAGTKFTGTDGIFEAGKTYKISTNIYAPESSGGFNIYWNLESTTATGLTRFDDSMTGRGTAYKLEVIFTAQEGDTVMGWYPANLAGTAVIYVGDFTIAEAQPEIETDIPTAAQISAGYTWNWVDTTMNMEANQGEIIDKPGELANIDGFGTKVLRTTMVSAGVGLRFTGTDGIFEAGKTYKISTNIYAPESSGGFNIYWNLESTTATGLTRFDDSMTGKGAAYALEVTFTAQEGDTVMGWYPANLAGTAVIYVGDFTIAEVQPEIETDIPTAAQISAGYTWNWFDTTMNMEANQGEIIDKPEELANMDGFSAKVMKITMASAGAGLRFTGTEGIFEAGKTYKISTKIYAPTSSGGFNIYWNLESTTTTGLTRFDDSMTGKGKSYILEVSFTAQEGDTVMGWYPAALAGTAVIHVGDFTIIEVVK